MSFSLEIKPEWNVIKKIKDAIKSDSIISAQERDFMDAAQLVAIELAENALKYSDPDTSQPVEFGFTAEDGQCVIRVKNWCRNEDSKQALQSMLKEIGSGNPFELYVGRLEKLKDDPDGWSRMGLYRIAYEGEFVLTADIDKESVTLVAKRAIPG
ncbi:MAG: hypothetical protein HY042_10420 [Spirochaetia bacterium]|nr:hypothetical protein [Spirochaetia bacterium]